MFNLKSCSEDEIPSTTQVIPVKECSIGTGVLEGINVLHLIEAFLLLKNALVLMRYSLGIRAEEKISFPRTLGISCEHFSGNHRFHGRFSPSLVLEVMTHAYVEHDYDLLAYADASYI